MIILGIETSCDETAVSILKAEGGLDTPSFKVLGNALYSQVKIHAEYGGVFPKLAKREHSLNLLPLFAQALEAAGMQAKKKERADEYALLTEQKAELEKILDREPYLLKQFLELIPQLEKPDIDSIAVTAGPGLEPALWVGISFAKALSHIWNIPLVAVNHMEGHIVSPLISSAAYKKIIFPALSLLISGGHTELVLMRDWHSYEIIGQTRDDAVGEAFDKVARMMDLPYPGGPHISRLAAENRNQKLQQKIDEKMHKTSTAMHLIKPVAPLITLPRPMIKTDDYDFSFSGLKTAVLYALQKLPDITEQTKKDFAEEFENAVTDVLVSKTKKALEEYDIKTFIIGGGVVSNVHIKGAFEQLISQFPEVQLLLPEPNLSTDNAIMIAAAGYISLQKDPHAAKNLAENIVAKGNLSVQK